MALARWTSVLVSAIACALFVVLIFAFSGGYCTASPRIISKPVDALLSTPWPNERLFSPYAIVDPPCTYADWPSFVTTWLILWGPICLFIAGAGFVAARHGGPISISRGMLAAALAAAIPLTFKLNDMLSRGSFTQTEALHWFVTVLGLSIAASLLGLLGALVAKRHA
jgi:hypothetical protein